MQWLQQSQPLFYLPGEQVKQNKVGKTLAVVSSSPNIHLNENWKKTERQLFLSSDYCNHQDNGKLIICRISSHWMDILIPFCPQSGKH